jgi:hypothetical protein
LGIGAVSLLCFVFGHGLLSECDLVGGSVADLPGPV